MEERRCCRLRAEARIPRVIVLGNVFTTNDRLEMRELPGVRLERSQFLGLLLNL